MFSRGKLRGVTPTGPLKVELGRIRLQTNNQVQITCEGSRGGGQGNATKNFDLCEACAVFGAQAHAPGMSMLWMPEYTRCGQVDINI